MIDLKLEGSWTNYHYDTGEPYQVEEGLEIEDEGSVLLVCDTEDECCLYVLPEWVDDIVSFLLDWKEKALFQREQELKTKNWTEEEFLGGKR